MHLFVCIAGLPTELAVEITSNSPVRFTGSQDNLPIVRRIKEPLVYRPGMSDYYLEEIARRISSVKSNDEVSVLLAYVDYGGYSSEFVRQFFPFALAAPIRPFYPNVYPKNSRRSEMLNFLSEAQHTIENLRRRAAIVRDHLSGQNFSPLTLPLKNFKSEVLVSVLNNIFDNLGSVEDPHAMIQTSRQIIEARHPIVRTQDHLPYFQDERGLRFKSPGRGMHGWNRNVSLGHKHACLINSRARFGGSLKPNFHYDCEYERRKLDDAYPNCHDEKQSPTQNTHVNIAPNDAIR